MTVARETTVHVGVYSRVLFFRRVVMVLGANCPSRKLSWGLLSRCQLSWWTVVQLPFLVQPLHPGHVAYQYVPNPESTPCRRPLNIAKIRQCLQAGIAVNN